ncbi:MAG TPA: DNA polymerase III subunit epsilon [Desulfotomaculum sp.]|nr:MAG: hypothetical protein JL56_05445 [Desulfotomaculum sp. BICA1-6]HBX22342.1 DNA polymerase III subunit epsilon [Desulfotomaculum sp.]
MDKTSIAGIIDVETTGFSPYKEEIVELGLVLFSFNCLTGQVIDLVDEYTGLREPAVPISRGASMVHGLDMNVLRGQELDQTRIRSMLGRAEFITAHNARFDYSFVVKIFDEAVQKPWLCTMNGINWSARGFRSKKLQELINQHGIEVQRCHRAADDAKAVLALLSLSGQNYLSELLRSKPLNQISLESFAETAIARDKD